MQVRVEAPPLRLAALALAAAGLARAIVDQMIGLWNGDLPALREHHAVGFCAEGAHRTIELRPLRAPIDQVIERIELEGDGPRQLRMQLVERGGTAASEAGSSPQAPASPPIANFTERPLPELRA